MSQKTSKSFNGGNAEDATTRPYIPGGLAECMSKHNHQAGRMDDVDPFALAALGKILEEDRRHNERVNHTYDGVLGCLPEDRFPESMREEFIRLRNKILDHVWPEGNTVSPKVAKKWIEAYLYAGQYEGLVPPAQYWPHEFHEETGRLAQFYNWSQMSERKAIKLIYGETFLDRLVSGAWSKVKKMTSGLRQGTVHANLAKESKKQKNEMLIQAALDRIYSDPDLFDCSYDRAARLLLDMQLIPSGNEGHLATKLKIDAMEAYATRLAPSFRATAKAKGIHGIQNAFKRDGGKHIEDLVAKYRV